MVLSFDNDDDDFLVFLSSEFCIWEFFKNKLINSLCRRCQKLESWITSKGLQSEGLTHLSLRQWNEVKSFPREGCLPASLRSLQLSKFSNLETLDYKGLLQLTSLQQLTIGFCPKLENITQQNLPASILKLIIKGECPLRSKLEEMNDPRIQFQTGWFRLGVRRRL
ncbi:putative disease resistance protein At3g14460 [Arachis ipaensis]|uniref:putative disease resistance protein At3g14460 n=1 Tax=Arachis ipaensis TaxID=130454 RepID=UPI0007AFBCEF|nr:putative disease resistance protein At3g14460 [Arachis ipaensis]